MLEKIKRYFHVLSARNRGVSQEVINFVDSFKNNPERFYLEHNLKLGDYDVGYDCDSYADGVIQVNGLEEFRDICRRPLSVAMSALSICQRERRPCTLLIDKDLSEVYLFKEDCGKLKPITHNISFINRNEQEYLYEGIYLPVYKKVREQKAKSLRKGLEKVREREKQREQERRQKFGENYVD